MGFSIGGSQNTSTILAELALSDGGDAQEMEGLTVPQELPEGETSQQTKEGMLRGGSKEFAFVKQQGSDLARQLSDSLLDMQRPQQNKLADPKSPLHHLSFKENLLKEKMFKTLETHTSHLEKKQSQEQTPSQTSRQAQHDKAHQAARQVLKEAQTPPTAARIRENSLKQQQSSSRTIEQRVHKELKKSEGDKAPQRRANEGQLRANERQTPSLQERYDKNLDKNEEREQKRERERREEEEGFADGGHQGSGQDDSSEGAYESDRVRTIDKAFAKEFNTYAAEESILSQIFNMRISQFDVLILFLEIMKLDLKSRELQKLARQSEREMQIMHMQKVVENYKGQGNYQLFSSLGSGVLAIISGLAPVLGHMPVGDWLIEKLGGFISSLRDMEKDKLVKMVTKVTFTMSEMQKNTGQIQSTFAEGHRTFDQHMSELYRADWDESTRTMEEIKDNWKGIENFLYQTLQMYHDAVRSLYS